MSGDEIEHRPEQVVDNRYELIELLGRGGMGEVWRAIDRVLDLEVALKLVSRVRDTPGALQRLLQEARASAGLQHPGVVRVYAFGQADGEAYIAMERLEGGPLDDLIDTGPLPPAQAVRLLIPIAEALAFAHTQGVVHRDVKPDNIMISRGPTGATQPKLVDFGIAQVRDAHHVRSLTMTGQVLGTPHYMSPEQAGGCRDIDHRVDVWSLCVVLYETIAGVLPFDGDNYNAVLRAVLMDAPSLGPLASVDQELVAIIDRGLRKNRDERYPTMQALAAALFSWIQRQERKTQVGGPMVTVHQLPAVLPAARSTTVRLPPEKPRRRPLWALAAVLTAWPWWLADEQEADLMSREPRARGSESSALRARSPMEEAGPFPGATLQGATLQGAQPAPVPRAPRSEPAPGSGNRYFSRGRLPLPLKPNF